MTRFKRPGKIHFAIWQSRSNCEEIWQGGGASVVCVPWGCTQLKSLAAVSCILVPLLGSEADCAEAQIANDGPSQQNIIQSLMQDSVTMMDWGLMNAQHMVDKILKQLNDEQEREDEFRNSVAAWEIQTQAAKDNGVTPAEIEKTIIKPDKRFVHYLNLRRYGYHYEFGWSDLDFNRQMIVLGVSVTLKVHDWMYTEEQKKGTDPIALDALEAAYFSAEACADIAHDTRDELFSAQGLPWGGKETRDSANRFTAYMFMHHGFRRSNMPVDYYARLADLVFILVKLTEYPTSSQSKVECMLNLPSDRVTLQITRH